MRDSTALIGDVTRDVYPVSKKRGTMLALSVFVIASLVDLGR